MTRPSNQIVICIAHIDTCSFCDDEHRMEIRVTSGPRIPGGIVGIIPCPICRGLDGLADFLAPHVKARPRSPVSAPPDGVA